MGKSIQSILGYTGVRAATPPNVVVKNILPQPTFSKNFKVGDFWLYLPQNVANSSLWVLMSLSAGVADWVEIATGGDVGIFNDFVAITNNTASATAPAELDLIKTRNGGAIVAGDELGCINFVGTDTTPLQIIAASICAINPATSTIAPNRVAGVLQFSTHPDSASGVTPILRMELDEAGTLFLNKSDSDTYAVTNPTFLNFGSAVVSSNQENDTSGAVASLFKQRPLGPIQSGDTIGSLNFMGQDTGGTNIVSAQIRSTSSGTIAANRIAGNLQFYTHPDSVTVAQPRMQIASSGNVTISKADNDTFASSTGASFGVIGTSVISQSNETALATTGAVTALTRSRNYGPITSGDNLGSINFSGYDSNSLPGVGASITVDSDPLGTIGINGRVPGKLIFLTHPDAAGPNLTERMTIESAGNVVINQADNDIFGFSAPASFSVVGSSILSQSDDAVTAAAGAHTAVVRTRAEGPITTGDTLGNFVFAGYDSNSLPGIGAQIDAVSTGTIGINGRIPGVLRFFTHPDAAGPNITERMRIDENGSVTIFPPSVASEVSLEVQGSVSVGGDPGGGVLGHTDFTNATAVAGGGAGAVALQAGGVGVAQAGWLKIYVNNVPSWIPYYQ